MTNKDNINKDPWLQIGTVIRDTYRIDGYISRGGFSATYAGTNINLDEKYIITEFFMSGVSQREGNSNMISIRNSQDIDHFNDMMEEFKKVAQLMRELNNDHIVRVLDLFEENGTAYYVMEFFEGESLKERFFRTKTPLSEYEANDIMVQILDALQHLHAKGIWYLDLSPYSVIVTREGVVKLRDFNISKMFGNSNRSVFVYRSGFSPNEQMKHGFGEIGPWTDFYALGALLYYLLTGNRPPLPYVIDEDHTIDKHLALPLPASISDKMRNLILWLMKPNLQERPKSTDAILCSINQLYKGID